MNGLLKRNKFIAPFLLSAAFTAFISPNINVRGAEVTTLFSETFSETVYGSAGSIEVLEPWVQEGSDSSMVKTHNSIFKSAPNGVKVDKTDSISTKISTAGYQNIKVDFWYRCSSIKSGKVVVEYSANGGVEWTDLLDIDTQTGKEGVDREFTLDEKANDNPEVKLRIRTDSLDGNIYLDDITVTGLAKSPAASASSQTPIPSSGSYTDITNGMWAKPYIESLIKNSISIPTVKDKFLPDKEITRAEFTFLLVQALKLDSNSGNASSFSDVKSGEWYESSVGAAVKAGIITAFEDGTFRPDSKLSRQDMAVIAANAMKAAKSIDILNEGKDYLIFTDKSKIDADKQNAVATAVKYGVISGKPGRLFDPGAYTTRAEAAKVVSKLMGTLTPIDIKKLNPDAATAASVRDDNEISTDDVKETANIGSDKTWYHDIKIGKGGDRIMKMDIVTPKEMPDKPLPVIVYIYGGGWNKGSKDDHINGIAGYVDKGYIGAAIEYRLTNETTFPGQLEDCKLAIRYIRANAARYGIDPDRIGVWGSSAGSHLASLLGTTGDVKELEGNGGWQDYSSRVQAVIDWYGPADFTTEFANNYSSVTKLLGTNAFADPDKARRAMPGTYASKDDPPFLVMHGDKDQTIPYYDSVAFAQALKRAGVDVTFKIVKGAPHGFSGFPEATKMAWEFLDKHLKNK